MSEPERDPLRTFFGVALVAVGAMIATLCGLCTGAFLISGLLQPGGQGVAALAIPVGGIPTAVGLLLYWAGRKVLKPIPSIATPSDKSPPEQAEP
jgi:hypothetical protein